MKQKDIFTEWNAIEENGLLHPTWRLWVSLQGNRRKDGHVAVQQWFQTLVYFDRSKSMGKQVHIQHSEFSQFSESIEASVV